MEKDQGGDHLLSIVKPSAKIGIASLKRKTKRMSKFTANDARKMAQDTSLEQSYIEREIIPVIRSAARAGRFSVAFSEGDWSKGGIANSKWQKYKKTLEELGFSVKMVYGDQRDTVKPYTEISWL